MAKLVYLTNTSLDGYIADSAGGFDFADPAEVHPVVVDLLQDVGTYLYGRRLYEMMAYWDGPVEDYPAEYRPFARMWQAARKVVFSRSLATATTRDTRVERDFNADAIRRLKSESERDIAIGGAELASVALEFALLDECRLLVHPVIFGGGKPALRTAFRRNLELVESSRFGTGSIYLRYRVL